MNKNATLCKSIDELFQKARDEVTAEELKSLAQKVRISNITCAVAITMSFDHYNLLLWISDICVALA